MKRFGLFAFLLTSVALASSQEIPRLTVEEWLAGKGRTAPVPRATWAGKGIILRNRGDIPERYDPLTGTRTPLYETAWMDAALVTPNLARMDRPANRVGALLELDASGRYGLFETATKTSETGFVVADFGRQELTRIASPGAKSFQFSPDGSHIAFVENNDLSVAELGRVPGSKNFRRDAKVTRLTNTGSETLLNGTLNWVYWEEIFGRRDIGYWWSPDSSAIAFLETDQSKITPTYFSDHRTKDETVIKQYYPKAGTPNPKVRVGVIDLKGPVSKAPIKWIDIPAASYEYILRVKWLPDSKQVAIVTMNRPQTDVELIFAPRVGGKGKVVHKEHDDAYVNVTDDLTFLKGGKEFLWASEKTGYYHLYRFDANGKELNAVTKGNWGLVSNPGPAFWVRQSISGVDEKNGWVFFTTNKDEQTERHLYRVQLDGTGMERLTKEPGVHEINFDPNGTRFLDTFSNLTTPRSLTLADPAGSRIPLHEAQTEIPIHIDTPIYTKIKARDGFEMPAHIKRPRDYKEGSGKKYPVIIYCYGGPSAPSVLNEWKDGGWDQVLCDAGYAVVVVDNRTATAISKKLEAASLKEYMGKVELDDLVDAARWLKAQPWVDAERVGVWGWSNGGTYTLLGMTRSTEFKVGIAVAAVVDQSLYDSKWAESTMKTPEVNRAGYEEVRLDKYAKDLSGRLLLVHGTYDDNVHPQQAYRFIDALIEANKPFDMMMYPMRMHGIGDMPARRHLYTTMLEFWKRWL